MRKLLRHLIYLPIWIALVKIGLDIILRVRSRLFPWLGPPAERLEYSRAFFAYHGLSINDYVWLFTPLAVIIAIWAVVHLLHRKRPSFNGKGGGVV